MAPQHQVIEGTWEEVQEKLHALKLSRGERVKLVLSKEGEGTSELHGTHVTFGMFPELQALTDEDFKAAEFHGDPDDGLDWS